MTTIHGGSHVYFTQDQHRSSVIEWFHCCDDCTTVHGPYRSLGYAVSVQREHEDNAQCQMYPEDYTP